MNNQLTKQQSKPGFYKERPNCRRELEKLMAERDCTEEELLASQSDSWRLSDSMEKQLRKMIAEKNAAA